MTRRTRVTVVHHRGQRGRFTRTGRADHQHQAAFFHDQLRQLRRHIEHFELRNIARDVANNRRITAALAHGADTEVADIFNLVRHVQLAQLFQLLHAQRRQNLGQEHGHSVQR